MSYNVNTKLRLGGYAMNLTGSDIIMECLLEQDVNTVFGYPGGSIIAVYDSLYKYSDKIKHILTSHEQGAAHAADGYSRSTGKTGVVLATSGPGATNLVTGIATAYMDSIPLVAITCNVSNSLLGKDSFQEIDIISITMPITKHNFLVKKAADIAPTIRKAFEIANSGRPGPVLVDITKDATTDFAEFYSINKEEKCSDLNISDIKNAAKLIKKSKRPLIFAGGGVISADASNELKQLQEIVDCPVTLSLMGLGGFPSNHKAFTGMIGMHGTKTTAFAVQNCDLLIAVGTRFSDRVTCDEETFAKDAKIIHIDIDRAEINKNILADLFIVGNAKDILSKICSELAPMTHTKWMNQIINLKKQTSEYTENDGFNPGNILKSLYQITDGNAIITTDVGQHQMWAAQFYPINLPRHFISSGGLGTMGFGIGAAIGVQIGNPDKRVINISGDGCFHMNMNELSTAVKEKLPIIDIIFNNNSLGMVKQWQKIFFDGRFSHTILDKQTDYDLITKGFGANAYTVKSLKEFEEAVKQSLENKDKPSVINCIIDNEEAVLPMVPNGTPIEKPIINIK